MISSEAPLLFAKAVSSHNPHLLTSRFVSQAAFSRKRALAQRALSSSQAAPELRSLASRKPRPVASRKPQAVSSRRHKLQAASRKPRLLASALSRSQHSRPRKPARTALSRKPHRLASRTVSQAVSCRKPPHRLLSQRCANFLGLCSLAKWARWPAPQLVVKSACKSKHIAWL